MDEATGERDLGVWQPPAPDLDGGEATRGAATMPPGLDGSRPQAGDAKKAPPKAGGRRRASVAFLAATGVIALAAAPFAVVPSKEHLVGEPASSASKEHHKPAVNKPTPGRTVAPPVPTWPAQSSPGHPGSRRPAPREVPDRAMPRTRRSSPKAPDLPVPSLSLSPRRAAPPASARESAGGQRAEQGPITTPAPARRRAHRPVPPTGRRRTTRRRGRSGRLGGTPSRPPHQCGT
jgi:hypothetical protein